jgi:uncharacterized phage protein (TIGR02218 family)
VKAVTPGLAQHLEGEVTTLCRCWKLQRIDGVELGFTDHDRDLAFDGVLFEAGSGFAAGDMEQRLGLNADSDEIAGALSSDRIREADVRADRFDGASVETWLVNWADVSQCMLDRVQTIGEVREEGGAFRAELLSHSARYDETAGRRFSRLCDADLGDARCGVDLDTGQRRASLFVICALSKTVIEVSGLESFPANWFRGGRLVFTGGDNEGLAVEIAAHRPAAGRAILDLFRPMAAPPQPGDAATLTAGCDKTFQTCVQRFSNGGNFRGCPHIPGADFVFGYASSGKEMDGGALVP